MLLKLMEVYEEVIHHNKAEGQKKYLLRDVVINRRFITCMRDDQTTYAYLKEGRLPPVLTGDQKFTRISVARGNIGQDIVVVGELSHVAALFSEEELIGKSSKKTLKG
jgi:hypothetical protein